MSSTELKNIYTGQLYMDLAFLNIQKFLNVVFSFQFLFPSFDVEYDGLSIIT